MSEYFTAENFSLKFSVITKQKQNVLPVDPHFGFLSEYQTTCQSVFKYVFVFKPVEFRK